MKIRLLCVLLPVCVGAHAQSPKPIDREIPEDVVVHRDIVYASYGSRELLLDLYLPLAGDEASFPTIVVVRGGGWRQGDKEGFGPLAAALAARGFAAASIEYRASGEAVFPAAVEDTKAAVRWIRANADEFGLDPESIGALGGSAGAHLALYLGVTANVPELEGEGGNPNHSSSISTVVGLATPGDFEALRSGNASGSPIRAFMGVSYRKNPGLWREASPTTHIDSASPPTLLIHGLADNVVPSEQSVLIARSLAGASVPVEVVFFEDAPHAFWNFELWFDDTMNRAAAFFRKYL
jgi:acetyl esterase/lipase